MMTIDKFNFAGKKAIVRVDFNVPLNEEGKITAAERRGYDTNRLQWIEQL